MSQDSEKYVYFTVGLLKDSFALEALQADALKHHMIDQPARLIALRLTEYYDLLTRVAPTVPGASLLAAKNPNLGTRAMTDYLTGHDGESADELVEEIDSTYVDEPVDEIVTTSAHAEWNADEAADYWAAL